MRRLSFPLAFGWTSRAGVSVWLPAVLLCALGLAAGSVSAQPESANYYNVLYVTVKPDKFVEYQQAVVELFAAYKKLGYKYPIQARSFDDEMVLRFITPMDGLGDLEKLDQEQLRVAEAGGKGLEDIFAKVAGASVSTTTTVYRTRLDLSYQPDNPEPPAGEGNFQYLQFWYARRDSVAEIEENAKAYAALFRKNGINRGFLVLESVVGDAPLYVAVSQGRSAADYYTRQEAISKKLGEAGSNMFLKTLATTHDYRAKQSSNMPDLSYVP